MTETTGTAATDKRKKLEVIELEEPIQRGETTIDKLTIRKPQSGELRGLTLEKLLNSDVDTLLKLLPRITDPILIDQEVAEMDPADLTQCGNAVRGFFMTKGMQEALERMLEAQQ